MKQKLLGLLILSVLSISVIALTVSASEEVEEATTAQTEVETTTQAVIPVVKKVKKTVKVNKKAKLKTTLKIKKVSKYVFVTGNKKVATVSTKGVITGKKKGKTTVTVIEKATGYTIATVNVKVKNRFTKEAHRLMSAIIESEAGDEPYAGKKAVGIVIMNRIASPEFPATLVDVIYENGQFTPTVNGSLKKSYKLYDKGKVSSAVRKAATATLNGDKKVKLNGRNVNMASYHFFSGYVKGAKLSIGGHQFK